MERRVLIAIFLSFVVLYAYQALFVRPVPKTASTSSPAASTATTAPSAGSATTAPAPAPGSANAAAPAGAANPTLAATPAAGTTALIGATEEHDVRVETPNIIAVFTNRGARLKSWRLKGYKDNRGEPLELVATELAATHPLPFSLRVADEATTGTLNGALYKVQGSVPEMIQGAPAQLTFEYQDSAGLHAVKQFTIDPSTYTAALNTTVTQGDQPVPTTLVWGPGLGDSDSQSGRYAVKPGGLFASGGRVTRLTTLNIASQPTFNQDFDYAGVDDHYFMSVAMKTGVAKLIYQPISIPAPAGSKDPGRDFVAYSIEPTRTGHVTFFVGPKDFATLAGISPDFTKAINFGMF